MKKTILSLTLSLIAATSLFAAKAKPGICQVQLVDGTYVSASLYGDENFHYYALTDGTPLERTANGRFEKISLDAFQAKRAAAFSRLQMQSRASGIASNTPSYFPHKGSPKALVILVQFQDVKFKSSDPVATFNHYLNAQPGEEQPEANKAVYSQKASRTNYGSVRQYFTDMSEGQFTPQFDVVGPVTVSKSSAYYGHDNGNGEDIHYKEMISEACALVADKVDFSQYDSNNDNYVDLVYFIYAGYSQSEYGNSDDCLWPKSGAQDFYKYDLQGGTLTTESLRYNGKRIKRFGINNELNANPEATEGKDYFYLNGIGLFCHEFSHTLGLPDLYVTSSRSAAYYNNNQSPEYWDLMDAGEYTNNGYCPTPYSPWEKMMMGWKQPENLPAEEAQITLEPYDKDSKAYKIDADVNDDNFKVNENYGKAENLSEITLNSLKNRAQGEYLLLQNVRNEGWWKGLPGYGLLVWRIDYADLSSVNLGDNPNNIKGIPRVMIVPADGLVINSTNLWNNTYTQDTYDTSLWNDPFPVYKDGSATEYAVDKLTEVNFNWSTMTSRPLYNIKKDEETGLVTFDYLKDFNTTGIRGIEMDSDNRPTEYFDLEGRKIPTPQKGHLYVTNKGKKVIL